jgi:glycosyltransferase involved in cell wall biosynthesis
MKSQIYKRTILHVIDSTEPGGAETVFVQLADELRNRGYRCITVVSGEGWATDELRRRNFEPIVIDAKGTFNFSLLRGLVRIIREEQVDVIQSHLLGSNVYCALAGFLSRTPVVATFHGMVDVSPNERMRWLKFQILNIGVARFVTVSHALCDAIHKERLLNRRKTTVIYNGIKLGRYGKLPEGSLRRELNLGAQAIVIGSLGNLHPAKGYDYLVRSAKAVCERHPEVHFVVGGEIKEQLLSDLKALAVSVGVSDRVHFVGFVTDSAAFLSQLNLFVLSSISEGFSIATVEAMASGLPVVATRCGGPEEILVDGVDSILVPPANENMLSAAIIELISSPSRCSSLGQSAKVSAERFSTDVMISRYLSLYETETVTQ